MKKTIFIALIFLGIISCNSEIKTSNLELVKTNSYDGSKYLIFEPIKYISKYDTIHLNYKDSLKRIFKTDSSSIIRVNLNYYKDSVFLSKINLGGISIPVSDSINYNIIYGFSKHNNKENGLNYNINYNNRYSKIDSNAYIEFQMIDNSKLNSKISKLLMNTNKQSVSMKEFKSTLK